MEKLKANDCSITQEELKLLVTYDPDTGKFCRLTFKKGHDFIHINDAGYIIGVLNGKKYRAHHLAWLYVNGVFPTVIDHINGIRTDNRISNLREVSNLENCMNKCVSTRSTTKVNGVSFMKTKNKYRAYITLGSTQIHLGVFSDIESATEARRLADIKYGFHENHGRPND